MKLEGVVIAVFAFLFVSFIAIGIDITGHAINSSSGAEGFFVEIFLGVLLMVAITLVELEFVLRK